MREAEEAQASMMRQESTEQSVSARLARASAVLGLLAAAALLPAVANPARAEAVFGSADFDGEVLEEAGEPFTQAGGHPHSATISIDFNSHFDPGFGSEVPDEDVKTIQVDLPAGLVGDPAAAPTCPAEDFANDTCPDGTVVGILDLTVAAGAEIEGFAPVYNLEPGPSVPARFGVNILSVTIVIEASVTAGPDPRLRATIRNIPQPLPILNTSLTLWGIPTDSSHDPVRGACLDENTGGSLGSCPAGTPRRPFLSLPTSCVGPVETNLSIESWQSPGEFVDDLFVSHDNLGNPIGAEGCGNLSFDPSISVQPASTQADSPTGLEVELAVPQSDNPDGTASAHLRTAEVILPEGTTVSPAAADGLGACTQAEIGLETLDEVECPNASKIGSVEVETPLLPDSLQGAIYLADPDDNPFDELLAIYLVAEGPGVLIKLPGRVEADPASGRLVAGFDDNPQFPFESFKLSFKGGPRAPLATPPTCGTKTTQAALIPWSAPQSGEAVELTDSFEIDSGPNGSPCATALADRPFAPGLLAGTVTPLAGEHSPFVLRATRADGEQELKRISVDLPPGVIGTLAGIPYCSEAQLGAIPTGLGTGGAEAASPTCPAASQVGTSRVGAGAGSSPFYIPGKVYLTGPYNGAPLGLAIVTPALAGPFDLGNVVVRAALEIDPDDAQIHVLSDSIPHILQGIPLRVRDVRVVMDRPNFTLNPTSCDPMAVTGQLTGAGGDLGSAADDVVASVSDQFQVGGCGGLGFSPSLSSAILGGKAQTKRSAHPDLRFEVTTKASEANLKRAEVTLPSSVQIDQANLGNLCSEADLVANECAGKNTIGSATATTPLLDTPLQGPVYAVSGSGGLPRLALILNGPPSQPVELLIRSDTTAVGNRLKNTFPLVPDAPITSFALTIDGGPQGYLVNNRNLCTKVKRSKGKRRMVKAPKSISDVVFIAHNNKVVQQKTSLLAPCGKGKKPKGSKKRKR